MSSFPYVHMSTLIKLSTHNLIVVRVQKHYFFFVCPKVKSIINHVTYLQSHQLANEKKLSWICYNSHEDIINQVSEFWAIILMCEGKTKNWENSIKIFFNLLLWKFSLSPLWIFIFESFSRERKIIKIKVLLRVCGYKLFSHQI